MGKTAVVYKSKYGTTKRYAEWIAEDTGADLFECSKISADALKSYDSIVYGGGLYAGGIIGFSLIKKGYEKLRDKNIIVFAVGASTQAKKAEEEVIKRNFTDEMRDEVQFFFLRGGYNYADMKPLDRLLMFILKKTIEKKPPEKRDDDEKGILATYGKKVNFTEREKIASIVEVIKE